MSHGLIVQMVYSYVQIRCLQIEFYSAKNIAQNATVFCDMYLQCVVSQCAG